RGAGGDRAADVTVAVGLRGRALLAVQRFGEDPRQRGLARPARPREQVGLPDLPRIDRVLERPNHRLLPDDLIEPLRTVLPVEGGHEPDAISEGLRDEQRLLRKMRSIFRSYKPRHLRGI